MLLRPPSSVPLRLRRLFPPVSPPHRHFSPSIGPPLLDFLSSACLRRRIRSNYVFGEMVTENPLAKTKRPVNFGLCKISGLTTEILEIQAENPTFHLLFIPGNPGVVSFYKDFVESLFECLEGNATVTAIGHISHTSKDWESGKLFSLQDQIDHKVDFIGQELQDVKVPIVLVGHSMGSYISLEILRKSPDQVVYFVGLYPFLALNRQSLTQFLIGKLASSSVLSVTASLLIASLGLLSPWAFRLLVSKSLGKSWSDTAVQTACTHLSQYHTVRNILFMTRTEFIKLAEEPDWDFMRENQSKLAFLFGIDDHWGPLQMFEEISRQVPDISLSIEREGHTHEFCCTVAGSIWVARHVASLIKDRVSKLQ